MMEYTNVERSLIQLISGHGTLLQDEAKSLYSEIKKKFENEFQDDRTIDQSIKLINGRISDYDQKIIHYHYPLTEKTYFMLINTAFTSVNKFQNAYTEPELNYLRLIINEIAESNDFHLNPMEVINLTSKLQGKAITKNRAQQLLDRFIMNGYFYNHNSKIYYGPKMITEFKDYLLQQFPDNISSCSLCKGIAIWGVACSNCSKDFHKACIKKYVNRTKNCPDCSQPWETALD